jgi:hypothetical protein
MAVLYRSLWERTDEALRTATHKPDPLPAHGDYRWGLSVVFRIDGPVLDALRPELDAMTRLRKSPHLVYTAENLHSTVRSLEGFQETVPAGQVEHYVDQLNRVKRGIGPIEVDYVGLSGAPGGIFVCGYPSPALAELRERLHHDQLPIGPMGVRSVDAERTRTTTHVSLVVFRPPLTDETKLAEYVSARSGAYYGRAMVRSLSLVRYRPTAESVHMEELTRVAL